MSIKQKLNRNRGKRQAQRIKLSDLNQSVQYKNGFCVYCYRQSLIKWSLSRGFFWPLGTSFSGKEVKVVEKLK